MSRTLRAGAVGTVAALLLGAAAQTASARTPETPRPVRPHSPVFAVEDGTARAVAATLGGLDRRALLRAATADGETDLAGFAARPGTDRRLAATVAAGNSELLALKGLDASVGPLLRIRLGDTAMRGALDAGAEPWVAAAPASDDATTLTAYDSRGRAHVLDATRVPARPVYLVDLDASRALAAGAEVLRRTLAPSTAAAPAVTAPAVTAAGWWGTRIDAVEVSDDEEPWFKGDAEMYALVTGFGLDGKVRVDPVDMPYLDTDGTVYRPNQILVNWSNYKYNLADVVLMEEDGDTNYQALAKAIADVLLTVTDQGAYIPLVNAVLDAIPTEWWTDDPDYVDSWYTLARTSTGRLDGARANGWMSVSPYYVSAF